MSFIDEKRKGSDRRVRNDGPPRGVAERRQSPDRRQTDMAEISFVEWEAQFAKFKGKAAPAETDDSTAAHAAEVLGRVGR